MRGPVNRAGHPGPPLTVTCKCSASLQLAAFVRSGRAKSEMDVPEKARRLCVYALAEAQGAGQEGSWVIECVLVSASKVRMLSPLAKQVAVEAVAEAAAAGKQRLAVEMLP